ncbi:MAG: VOC family protein [Gammaproteobacteria bacterium]
MQLPTSNSVFQNAWVVDDVEAAAMNWVNTFGIGPFFLAEYGPGQLVDITYRGRPAELNMLVAIAQAGPVQIELVQPLGDTPNPYRDTVAVGENKFHHVCVWSHDLDADLEYYRSLGCDIATTGQVKGSSRFAYVDSHPQLSCMLELLEHNAMFEKVFKMIADTCADWDGERPIRGYD